MRCAACCTAWRGSAHPGGEAGRVLWRGDCECALTGGGGGGGGDGRATRGSDPLRTSAANAPSSAPKRAGERSPVAKRSIAPIPQPAARLVAQPPLCSPCVPCTGRVHATTRRRLEQLIGGGGAGAPRGVPGGRQSDVQDGTPPPALCAAIMRPLPHPPLASSLNRPSARLVCPVQYGKTPLHLAAQSNPSVAVVLALLAAYPEAAKATDKVARRPRPYVPRSCGLSSTRRPPRRSAAPLLAVCATYSTGTRPSTAPLRTAQRWRW